MRVTTERHESGRIRIHKWVEAEMAEQTIPVSHEEVRIDREPIADGEQGITVTLTEDEREIILYEERPVVTKETVPVERVYIHTDQVKGEQTVRSELLKERIEVTREGGARTGYGTGHNRDAKPSRNANRRRRPKS